MRSICVVAVLAARTAAAHPPPPPEIAEDRVEWRETPAIVEWSTWLGFGVGAASTPATALARTTQPAPPEQHLAWTFSAGAEVTLPLTHAVRLGPWLGLAGLEPVAGAEVQITRAPAEVEMFFYRGEGVWTVRAGGGPEHATAAVAWGYRCPWRLWGPYTRATRYEIGARIVLAATRAYRDPQDWSATLGLEIEPVGAVRYLLGIKSWY